MSEAIECSKCHSKADSRDKFCGNCGNTLSSTELKAEELFSVAPDPKSQADDFFEDEPEVNGSEPPPWAETTLVDKARQDKNNPPVEERKVFSLDDDPTAQEEESPQEKIPEKEMDPATLEKARKRIKEQSRRKIPFWGWVFALLRTALTLLPLSLSGFCLYLGIQNSQTSLIVLGALGLLCPPILFFLFLRKQTGSHAFLSSSLAFCGFAWLFASQMPPQSWPQIPLLQLSTWEIGVFALLAFSFQWGLQILIETRLFWFFRLVLGILAVLLWADFLRVFASGGGLRDLSSPDHPLASQLVPWLDQAAWYLSPVWLFIHFFLPTLFLILLGSALVRLKNKDWEEAFSRFFFSAHLLNLALLCAPVFGEFRFSLLRVPWTKALGLPLPPL